MGEHDQVERPHYYRPDPIPGNERFIAQGGLMRCCLLTIHEATQVTAVGDVLDCAYEEKGNARLIVDPLGVWRWNERKSA